MKSGRTKLKHDSFRARRGGWSRLLLIACGGSDCGKPVLIYQKDGPGILKRLYLDRILAPESIAGSTNVELCCPHCPRRLGMQTTWHMEDRPAYQLFAGAVSKKIMKSATLDRVRAQLEKTYATHSRKN